MAARFSKGLVGVVAAAVACLGVAREDSADLDQVQAMLSEDVAEATVALRDRIEVCNQKAKERTEPKLDQDKLNDLGANREQLLTAFSHLHFRNSARCEQDQRQSLAYSLGVLEKVQRKQGEASSSPREVREGLIYPNLEELRYRARYRKLPEDLRSHMEARVGGEPFELVPALREHDLLKQE